MGKDLLTAFERIDAAADAEGAVPAAVLKTEFRRLGIDAPAEAAVIPVTDEKEPRGRRPESRRFNFGSDAKPAARAYRQIWDWFTRDIEPLADAKQSSLRPIDDTIRALEEERAKPGLSLLDRWMIDTNLAQLRVTRSKVNVAFPASPLDLAALGISAIGMVQVGNRANRCSGKATRFSTPTTLPRVLGGKQGRSRIWMNTARRSGGFILSRSMAPAMYHRQRFQDRKADGSSCGTPSTPKRRFGTTSVASQSSIPSPCSIRGCPSRSDGASTRGFTRSKPCDN